MLVKSYFYEFKMYFFDKGEPEEFLLFVRNFQMIIEYSGIIAARTNIQYLFTLLHGEALCQFNTLCNQVGITNTTNLNQIILGLGTYFPLLMSCQIKSVR